MNLSEPQPEKAEEAPLVNVKREAEIGFMDNIDYHRVADGLDVSYEDRKSPTIATKLSFLYDWAKEVTKSDDRITRLEAIKGLQKRLGIPGRGIDTIKKLYQWARLDQDRQRIEREQQLIG